VVKIEQTNAHNFNPYHFSTKQSGILSNDDAFANTQDSSEKTHGFLSKGHSTFHKRHGSLQPSLKKHTLGHSQFSLKLKNRYDRTTISPMVIEDHQFKIDNTPAPHSPLYDKSMENILQLHAAQVSKDLEAKSRSPPEKSTKYGGCFQAVVDAKDDISKKKHCGGKLFSAVHPVNQFMRTNGTVTLKTDLKMEFKEAANLFRRREKTYLPDLDTTTINNTASLGGSIASR